jgi:hypothetical protein
MLSRFFIIFFTLFPTLLFAQTPTDADLINPDLDDLAFHLNSLAHTESRLEMQAAKEIVHRLLLVGIDQRPYHDYKPMISANILPHLTDANYLDMLTIAQRVFENHEMNQYFQNTIGIDLNKALQNTHGISNDAFLLDLNSLLFGEKKISIPPPPAVLTVVQSDTRDYREHLLDALAYSKPINKETRHLLLTGLASALSQPTLSSTELEYKAFELSPFFGH